MLHPHLTEYPKAIITISEFNVMLEGEGVPAVDCVTFHELHEQSLKEKQDETQNTTGYKHSSAATLGMKLEWSLFYCYNNKKATGLFIEVGCTFFDNPLNRESQAIIARYHVGPDEWWFVWKNLTPNDIPDISSNLASELLFVSGFDITQKDHWLLERPEALKLIRTMVTLYKLQSRA